jgi:GntR family transcriptional regulator
MQVRDVLVNRIVEGSWKPGASLPNETVLAQQLGISIGTVRKALDIMEDERIVTRRQGRGTFVNDFSTQPRLFSSFVSGDGKGVVGEIRSKSVSRLSADEEAASRLEINIGDDVISVERIRFHRNKPFLTETCILPARFFRVLPEDLASYRLSVLAQHNGIIAGRADEALAPVGASAEDAVDLDVPEHTPLLSLDRVIYSDRGNVLECRRGRCFLRTERFVVTYQ